MKFERMISADHASPCRRLKYVFFCAWSLALLSLLLFYASTQPHVTRRAAVSHSEPWHVPTLLSKAITKLQSSIGMAEPSRKRKLVLVWTPYFNERHWLRNTDDLECPVSDCDITYNRSLLSESSAVILHWRNMDVNELPVCDPQQFCPPWVLFNKEAPPHTSRDTLVRIQDKVNWTVTYRRDSDFYAPYGKVVPAKTKKSVVPARGLERNRTCWLVSNCNTPSKRELFVKELQKHMDVDIYGSCSPQRCPFEQRKKCYRWLSEKCQLYLSLENSNCLDYITEKLYNALDSGMIPIVRGTNINYSAHLPPRSYINADDFSSPKELAEYLRNITDDQKLYRSYHWWRRRYKVVDPSFRWFCDLCRRLNDETYAQSIPRRSRNLISWWYNQSSCSS